MRIAFSVAVAAFGWFAGGCISSGEKPIADGENGSWSPDGRSIAFQRHNGRDYDIGIIDLATRGVEWVSRDAGEAAFPAWTADGRIVFTYCASTGTAYQAWKAKSADGFNLHIRGKDGTVRRLTSGRVHDSTCCLAPDGSFWFATTRGCRNVGQNRLWKAASVEDAMRAEVVRDTQGPGDFGINSPAVSPDGKRVVWAELGNFWRAWTIMIADAADPSEPKPLLGPETVAYSPVWHPDGRHILFTGYRRGDDGWAIYIADSESGAIRKLTAGQNPSVSPDGRRYLYDDTHSLFVKEFADRDFPGKEAAR